jgi:hypothetical protein
MASIFGRWNGLALAQKGPWFKGPLVKGGPWMKIALAQKAKGS